MSLVYRSTVASLIVQLVVAGFTVVGFFVDASEDVKRDINIILSLELGSQVVEFVWYLVVVIRYREILTWTRYIDWVVSTPLMLTSTVLFFQHRKGEADLWGGVVDSLSFYAMLVFNWCMLGFGFLFERFGANKMLMIFAGSVALVGSFTCTATFLPENDVLSTVLFWVTYFVWSLYGVAALAETSTKNIAYNALDIVSKNFYGCFLTIYLLV